MRKAPKQCEIGRGLIGLALTILFFLPLMVNGAFLSPTEVVRMWIQVYPHQMNHAAARFEQTKYFREEPIECFGRELMQKHG